MADSGLEPNYSQSFSRNTTSDSLNAETYKVNKGNLDGQLTKTYHDQDMPTDTATLSDSKIETEIAPKDQEFSSETNNFNLTTTAEDSEKVVAYNENNQESSLLSKENSEATSLQEMKGEQQELIKELNIPIELDQNFAPQPFKFDPNDLNIPIKYDHSGEAAPTDLPSLLKKLDIPCDSDVLTSSTYSNEQFNPPPDKASSEMAECDDTEPFYIYPKTKGQQKVSQNLGYNNVGMPMKHQYNSMDFSNNLGLRELSNKLGYRDTDTQRFNDLSSNQELNDLNRHDFPDLRYDYQHDRAPPGLLNYDVYGNRLMEPTRQDFYKKHLDTDMYGYEDSRYKRRRGSSQYSQSHNPFSSDENLQHHNLKLSQGQMSEPGLVGRETTDVHGREYYDPDLYNRDMRYKQDYGRITFSDMVNGFQSTNTHTYTDTAASHSFADTFDGSHQQDAVPGINVQPVTVENWAQCENCKKWRRLPLNVDTDQLPETWVCSLNVWDPVYNSCNVPEEIYPEHNAKNVQPDKIVDNENLEFNQVPMNRVGHPYHEPKHHKRGPGRSKLVSKGYNLMHKDMSDISVEDKRYSRDYTDRDGMRTPTINNRYYEDNSRRESSRRMSMSRTLLSPIVSNISSYDEECEVVKFNLPSANTQFNNGYFKNESTSVSGEYNEENQTNPFAPDYKQNLKRKGQNEEKGRDTRLSHPLRDRLTLYSDNLTSLLATELPHSALFLDNSKRHTVKEDDFAHDETKPKESVTKDVYIKEEGNININYAYKTSWNHKTPDSNDMGATSYSQPNERNYPDRNKFNELLHNRSDFLRIYNRLSTQIPTLSEIKGNEESQFSNSPDPESSDDSEDYDSDDQRSNPDMDNEDNRNSGRNSISKIIDKNDLLQLLYNFAQKQLNGEEASTDQNILHCNKYNYVNTNLSSIIKYKDQLDATHPNDSMDNPELVNYEPVNYKMEVNSEDRERNHYQASRESLKTDKETNEDLSRDDQSDDEELTDDQMTDEEFEDDNHLKMDKKSHLDYPLPNIKQLSKRCRNLDNPDQQNLNLDDPEINSNYSMLMQPIPQNFNQGDNLNNYNNNIIKMLSIPISYKSNEQEVNIQPDNINLLSLPIPDLSLPDLSMSDLNNSSTQYVA